MYVCIHTYEQKNCFLFNILSIVIIIMIICNSFYRKIMETTQKRIEGGTAHSNLEQLSKFN